MAVPNLVRTKSLWNGPQGVREKSRQIKKKVFGSEKF